MEHSPFSLLPQELIRKIFLTLLPDRPSFKLTAAPLLLTHVCSAWRSIAQDIPQLWFHITLPPWTECPTGIEDLTRLWISHAGNAHLSIDIALFNQYFQALVNSKESEQLDIVIQNVISLLSPHRAHFQNFWGVFPAACIPSVGIPDMVNAEGIFFYGTPTQDELLRIPESFFSNEDVRAKLELGNFKEKLKVLSISDCAVDVASIMVQTELMHLELFDLHRSTRLCQEAAFNLLGSLPNLQKCVLELCKQERMEWNGQSDRVDLNNLELLLMIWKFPADVSILLDNICTPNLVRLGLLGTPVSGPRSWTGLYDFLQTSQPPLIRMSLGNFEDVDIQLLDCLRCCPQLRHLSFDHSSIPAELFPALTCDGAERNSELLPHLEVLNFIACARIEPETLATLLRSRAKDVPQGYSCLHTVDVVSCYGIKEEHVRSLQESGVGRMNIRLTGDYLS